MAQLVKNPPVMQKIWVWSLGRAPGEGNGSPLQNSCLGNSMDRGAWQATIHGVARVGHDLATKPPLRQISLKCVWAFAGSVVETASCFFSWWQWRGAGLWRPWVLHTKFVQLSLAHGEITLPCSHQTWVIHGLALPNQVWEGVMVVTFRKYL